MQIRVVTDQPWDVVADVLVLPLWNDDSTPADAEVLAEIDRRTDGALGDYRRFGELCTRPNETGIARVRGLGAAWLLGVGIGDHAAFDPQVALRMGAASERRLTGRPVRVLAIWLPDALLTKREPSPADLAMLVARGVVEGGYEPYALYRTDYRDGPPQLDELVLVAPGADAAAMRAAAERGVILGEGAKVARDLAQRSSNDVNPEVLADEATTLGRRHGLHVEVFGPEKAAELGMGMFLAVGRGSDNPPRFIVLRNGAPGATDRLGRHLALVGKGVTFDSGGLSLKPSERMGEMKMDKTGAATVIAAIVTARRLAPDLPLLAVAPAVENLPGPHSTRPGDIVTALNGKVVEIDNTDAEGRLILGDALTYAERIGATHLVDVATLTGAVERALGKQITGAFGAPQQWYDAVAAAGRRQGERYWQLPLIDEYRPDMDSWYADFPNSGAADGSLVKSGLFLREFVTRPWVHLDIAGSAWLRKATAWAARGATGVAHATLVELALAGA